MHKPTIADYLRALRELGELALLLKKWVTSLLISRNAGMSFNFARDSNALLAVLDIYHSHMAQLLSLNPNEVRVNLMLLVGTGQGYGLRICLTKSKGSYSEQERRLIWDKGKGCCGRVWEEKTPLFADNQKWLKAEALPKKHAEATKNVHWVASLPIWDQRKQKFWGVLNVDTLVPLSNFPTEDWLEIATLYMRLLTHLCSSLRLFSLKE